MTAKWDNLPNELLEEMLSKLIQEEDPNQAKWMMVNNQWYDQYQSIKYKTIALRLDDSFCLLLNNIIYSRFQPGTWVKSIIFRSFKASTSSRNFADARLGYGGDPLSF